MQKVCTKDVEVDVSNDEGPHQTSGANSDGHCPLAVSRDRRAICRRERRASTTMLVVEGGSHPDGNLGTRFDKVVLPAIMVVYPYSVFVGF